MSFDATDIIPIEYQSLFQIISPLEKSGILKIIKDKYLDLKDKYEALFLALKDYLTNFQKEDISSLVFIMFGQISRDLRKDEFIPQILKIYPHSSELQYYNIQMQVDKGIFTDLDKVITKIRLKDDSRNMIFNRLVAADKLATIILDLQSFALEIMFYGIKEEYNKIMEVSIKAEEVWQRAISWSKSKEIIFVLELAARMILQKTQILMNSQNLDTALAYFEKASVQDILNQCQSNIMKANILHVSAMLYYNAGEPTKGLKQMDKAIKILPKIHGRNSWKSGFYHNLAYMYTLVDLDKCTEAYEKCLELLKDSQDLQGMATTLGNLIGLQTQANKKAEARKYLKQMIEILNSSEELVTPFRAYAVASNAMALDDYELAKIYLKKLDEKVALAPTNMNKAVAASAKFSYYLDAEINSEEAYRYGEESLYYLNKQKDYLNALAAVYNLVNTDFQFYKISEKERYLTAAKKRLNELLTLIGALDLPQWISDKNVTLAGFEILANNYNQAEKYIGEIPDSHDAKLTANKKMISQLLEFSKKQESEQKTTGEKAPVQFSTDPFLNEIATNKDARQVMIMYMIEKTMEELVKIPQQVNPIKADIKLILLINNAGLTLYTRIFDVQKMNQQLISNFISAIDSFGKQLFGTIEPYFSISRGNNIILFRNVNDELNIAIIVSQENYDAVRKLSTLSKEISEYLIDHTIPYNKTIDESTEFYNWLESKINELVK